MIEKREKLREILSGMDRLLVAYSGGVDSTLLLKVACELLDDRAAGAIVCSPLLPASELLQAREIARAIGARIIELQGRELDLPEFTSNSERRCYFCKDYRFKMLQQYAAENGWTQLVDGSNADDLGDYRPGRQAALERAVRSPLQEAGFTKQEIRGFARDLNLPNWDKPASACLASRIPYGIEITPALLSQVERAEELLRRLGFQELRVRHHGDTARIEIPPGEFDRLLAERSAVSRAFKQLGFRYVALDIEGFRSGSLNEGLTSDG